MRSAPPAGHRPTNFELRRFYRPDRLRILLETYLKSAPLNIGYGLWSRSERRERAIGHEAEPSEPDDDEEEEGAPRKSTSKATGSRSPRKSLSCALTDSDIQLDQPDSRLSRRRSHKFATRPALKRASGRRETLKELSCQ